MSIELQLRVEESICGEKRSQHLFRLVKLVFELVRLTRYKEFACLIKKSGSSFANDKFAKSNTVDIGFPGVG